MGTSRWTLLRSVYSLNFWECPEGKSSIFPQFRHQSNMSFLFPRVCWTHVCMCLFSLHNDSTSKATVSSPTLKRQTALCQLSPPTEDDRTIREKGKSKVKRMKKETLVTFHIRVWLKSCLPSGVCWRNLLTNKNIPCLFFLPFSFRASGFASLPLCLLIGSLSL